MAYQYRYVNLENPNEPIKFCPNCHEDLTEPDNIEIYFTDGSRHWYVESNLDKFGNLLDPTNEVAEGLHSCTCCANCQEMLMNMEDVEELQFEGEIS